MTERRSFPIEYDRLEQSVRATERIVYEDQSFCVEGYPASYHLRTDQVVIDDDICLQLFCICFRDDFPPCIT